MPVITGGVAGVASATVTLTNAQVLTLPTTPVRVVQPTVHLNYSGAPPAIPYLLGAVVILNNAGGLYTNVGTPCVITFGIGSDVSFNVCDAYRQGATASGGAIPDFDTDAVTEFSAVQSTDHIFTFAAPSRLSFTTLKDQIFDNAIVVSLGNAGLGNLTGGHAANSMTVTAYYQTLAIPA